MSKTKKKPQTPGTNKEDRKEKEKQAWKCTSVTDVKRTGNTRIRRISRHR